MSDNTINESKPFALDVKNSLHGANGMTFAKCIGEKNDDAFDAGGNPRWKSVQSDKVDTLMGWNMGENLPQLAKLFGLSNTISKKPADKIGLKNRGTFASFCYLQPDVIILVSRNTEGKLIELTFRFKEFIDLLENCHENYNDRRLIPTNFMEQSRITEDTKSHLLDLFKSVENADMKEELNSMFSTAPNFLFMAMEFGPMHRLFGKLDNELIEAFPASKLFYSNLIRDTTKNIMIELALPFALPANNHELKWCADKKVLILNKDNIVDLMWDNNCIMADVEVGTIDRADMEDTETVLKVTLSVSGVEASLKDVFFITNKPIKATCTSGAQTLHVYPNWSNTVKRGSFMVRLGMLSQEEDSAQMKELAGSDFTAAINLRGVYICWNKRYLGAPGWRRDGKGSKSLSNWPSQGNAGPIRVDVLIENNHYIVENLFSIQSDKGAINIDNGDSAVLRLIDSIVNHLEKNILQSTQRMPYMKVGPNVPKYKPDFTKPPVCVTTPSPRQGGPDEWFHLIKNGEFLPGKAVTPPSAPTNLTSNNIKADGFNISWAASKGADYYNFKLNGIDIRANHVVPFYSFNRLSPSTEYNVIVEAVNSGGSTASAVLKVTTSSREATDQPNDEPISQPCPASCSCLKCKMLPKPTPPQPTSLKKHTFEIKKGVLHVTYGADVIKLQAFSSPLYFKNELMAMADALGPKKFDEHLQNLDAWQK